MSKTVIITGASGFAGRYMCHYLRSIGQDIKIVGIDALSSSDCQCDYFYPLDLTDAVKVKDLFEKHMPDYVIHFAGTFGIGEAQRIYEVNLLSATAVLEGIRVASPSAVLVSVGSAAEYGRILEQDLPVIENTDCRPVTSYGLSKYLATQIVLHYHRLYGLCTMVARPFQMIGKGISDRLAPGAFAKRLMEARDNNRQSISVGNLESSRDFLDIRDAVRAFWLLCEKPKAGEVFNICSGTPVKMNELLKTMILTIGYDIRPVTDVSHVKSADVSVIYGSFKKIKDHCGWEPSIDLQQSIYDLLN